MYQSGLIYFTCAIDFGSSYVHLISDAYMYQICVDLGAGVEFSDNLMQGLITTHMYIFLA